MVRDTYKGSHKIYSFGKEVHLKKLWVFRLRKVQILMLGHTKDSRIRGVDLANLFGLRTFSGILLVQQDIKKSLHQDKTFMKTPEGSRIGVAQPVATGKLAKMGTWQDQRKLPHIILKQDIGMHQSSLLVQNRKYRELPQHAFQRTEIGIISLLFT